MSPCLLSEVLDQYVVSWLKIMQMTFSSMWPQISEKDYVRVTQNFSIASSHNVVSTGGPGGPKPVGAANRILKVKG